MPRWLSATVMATVVAWSSAVPPALASSSHRLPAVPAGERIGLAVGRPAPSPGVASPPATSPATRHGDKQQRFWVHDKHRYTSPWYAGARRKMVAFGCTRAPYYDPDPRCSKEHGYHHGLDLAMPCGTPLYAALRTRVVDPESAGSLGSAYGPWAFRLRSGRFHKDFVIGHVRHVFVDPGDVVARGTLIARASNAGAPDGCHLHFEARPRAGGYQSAVAPYRFLRLEREG
jgi:murein DD-endopeptidase MepM/ murein hydrolase activator NlpD